MNFWHTLVGPQLFCKLAVCGGNCSPEQRAKLLTHTLGEWRPGACWHTSEYDSERTPDVMLIWKNTKEISSRNTQPQIACGYKINCHVPKLYLKRRYLWTSFCQRLLRTMLTSALWLWESLSIHCFPWVSSRWSCWQLPVAQVWWLHTWCRTPIQSALGKKTK